MKKKFICTVCGCTCEGKEAPEGCSVCHARAEKFEVSDPKTIKGTKIEKNFIAAFIDESQVCAKCLCFASETREEDYKQLAAISEETARNEKEHVRVWSKFLRDGDIPTITDNTREAADGEDYEWTDMYVSMVKVVDGEGSPEIVVKFHVVVAVGKYHEEHYREMLKNIGDEIIFLRDDSCIWQCRSCGHVVVGKKAPETYPVCDCSQSYFQIEPDNLQVD